MIRTGGKPDNNYARHVYLLLVVTLLFLAVFLAVVHSVELFADFRLPEKIELRYFLGAAAFTLGFWFVASFAWQKLVSDCSEVHVPLTRCFSQIALLLVGKYLPGKLWGMAIRGKDLTKRGVSGYQALVCSYVEQLISVHAAMVIGGAGWLLQKRPDYWIAGIVLLVISALAGAGLHNLLARYAVKSTRFLSRRLHGLEEVRISFHSYTTLFLIYILEWILIGGILVFIWLAVLDPAGDWKQISYLLSANALAFVAGFIAFFTPGGIGVREGILVALLSSMMPVAEALNIAILYRVWLIVADAIVGLVSIRFLVKNETEEA